MGRTLLLLLGLLAQGTAAEGDHAHREACLPLAAATLLAPSLVVAAVAAGLLASLLALHPAAAAAAEKGPRRLAHWRGWRMAGAAPCALLCTDLPAAAAPRGAQHQALVHG